MLYIHVGPPPAVSGLHCTVLTGAVLLVVYDSVSVLANTPEPQYAINVLDYGVLVNTSNTTAVVDLKVISEDVDVFRQVNVSVRSYNDAGSGPPSYCSVWYPQGKREGIKERLFIDIL